MRIWSVALLLVIAACSEAVENTTTTSEAATTTSTQAAQQIVDGGLIPMDPPTLIPFEDAEPVVVGTSHHGVVSPDRRWAAIRTELTQGSAGAMVSMVDLTTNEVVGSSEVEASGLAITDHGQVFYFREESLISFGPESDPATVGTHQTPPYLHNSLSAVGDDRVGYLTAQAGERSNVSLVVADQTGPLVEIELSVTAGPVDGDSEPARHNLIIPTVAWTATTAFVISAEENHIEEVDLISGETTEHGYVGGNETFDSPVARSVWASDDGWLFIATSSLKIEQAEEGSTITETAQDMVVVDTSDWSSTVVDIAVSELTPSPVGNVLAALGRLTEVSEDGESTSTESPVYLVEASTGEPLVGFQGNSGTIVDVQFSADGAQMYVVSHDDSTNIDVVDVAVQELVGNVAFTRISLVGEAGLMAFHSTTD